MRALAACVLTLVSSTSADVCTQQCSVEFGRCANWHMNSANVKKSSPQACVCWRVHCPGCVQRCRPCCCRAHRHVLPLPCAPTRVASAVHARVGVCPRSGGPRSGGVFGRYTACRHALNEQLLPIAGENKCKGEAGCTDTAFMAAFSGGNANTGNTDGQAPASPSAGMGMGTGLTSNNDGAAQELPHDVVCKGRSDFCFVLVDVPAACVSDCSTGTSSTCPLYISAHGKGGVVNRGMRVAGLHANNVIGVYPQGEKGLIGLMNKLWPTARIRRAAGPSCMVVG